MAKYILYIGLFFSSVSAYTQSNQRLHIQVQFGKEKVSLDSIYYHLNSHDSLMFQSVKFYISQVKLYQNEKLVYTEHNSFHLVDWANPQTTSLSFVTEKAIKYNQLSFVLGIDSVTNVSGALGGDLDPTTGMYWTWQSGYINVKVEGRSSSCKTRNNEFQFHLGGYMFPNAAARTVWLAVKPKQEFILTMDLKPWLEQIKLSEQNHIMSPSAETVKLSEWLLKCISIQ